MPGLAIRQEEVALTMSEEINPVIEYLERAVAAAQEHEMSTSETIGLLFYYAHNVAQEAREAALRDQAET